VDALTSSEPRYVPLPETTTVGDPTAANAPPQRAISLPFFERSVTVVAFSLAT
jgi:hypothetical protein